MPESSAAVLARRRPGITTVRGWICEKPPIAADIVDHWDEIVDEDG
jgi:hypothetical protein